MKTENGLLICNFNFTGQVESRYFLRCSILQDIILYGKKHFGDFFKFIKAQ